MPIVQSELQRIYSHLDMSLQGALNAHPDIFADAVTMVPSAAKKNIYPYLGNLPGVREFIGPRVMNDLGTRFIEIANRKWENSIKMPEDDVEDAESLAFFSHAVAQLGENFRTHRNSYFTQTVVDGLTGTWPVDGQLFFDSDHPRNPDAPGANTFSNRFDTAGGNARPLTHVNFDHVWNAFRSIKNENGDPMVLGEVVCMVPQALETTANQVLKESMIVPGATMAVNSANILQPNPNMGRARVLVNPWLDAHSTTRWYLYCTGRVVKPLIWQDRRPLRTTQFTSQTDANVFFDGNYIYGGDARYACGLTMPQLICTADV